MNTTNPNAASTRTHALRVPILAAAASLLLAPCLFAQTPATPPQGSAAQPTTSKPDAQAEWVTEPCGRPSPNVLHWSIDPAVTKAFEPSGVGSQIVRCGDFTVLYNHGLYWSGEENQDVSKDMQASVVIFKGEQRVFVARGYVFNAFNFAAASKVLNFRYWTGVQGHEQITEFTLDLSGDAIQIKTIRRSTKDDLDTFVLQQSRATKPATPSGAGPKRLLSGDGLPPNHPAREKLYAVKFDGGPILKLRDSLRAQFSADNVVLSESVGRTHLPPFEIRNVRIAEIGRTIEFLGEGQLRVEVTENAGSGNVWLIGRKNLAEAAATVKMRSVAAPNLFANEKALADIQKAAEKVEMARRGMAQINGVDSGFRGVSWEPLRSQSIFAIIGDEDGVAGLESLIQVAEQAQAKAVADLLREAPKMKAVAAPHLFAMQERVDRFLEEYRVMTAVHHKVIDGRWETAGFGDGGSDAYQANIHTRPDADLFMLVGHPDAIAGIESLIQAAEQLAAAEDAILDTKLTPEQRVEQAQVRAAAKAEARAKEKARLEAKDAAEVKERAEAELKAAEKAAKEKNGAK